MSNNEANYTPVNYKVRQMEPRDSAAYRDLLAQAPAHGLITIQVVFKEDPYEMLMTRRLGEVVVVAETPDGKVVGTGAADARPVWFEGKPVQAVHLHSIIVHPDYRQHGVATALTKWRINWARQHYTSNVLVFAEIPEGNLAAYKNALKWATGFGQPREAGFIRVYKNPRPLPPSVTVREAIPDDFPAIAKGLNEYNYDVNFTRYVTTDRLRRNLEPIRGQVFRHRYVVEEHGEIVGGAVLSQHDPSVETRLIKAPLVNRMIARLSGMIYTDGIIHGGEIDGIWFKRGCADSTHVMLEYLRHVAAQHAAALNVAITNPKSFEALKISHWQPHTILSVAYLRPRELKAFSDTDEITEKPGAEIQVNTGLRGN
jgi:GNAT superfamily N-acetyltransferase